MKKSILSDLKSVDKKSINEVLTHLREHGKTSDLTPLLDLMITITDKEVLNSCIKFWADIKDNSAKPIILQAITDKKYASIQKEMVGICWQSSIDFTNNVTTFVDLLIHSDFETAFEAFTVIENLTGKIDSQTIQAEQKKLKNAIGSAPEELKGMIHEAMHLLENQNREDCCEE